MPVNDSTWLAAGPTILVNGRWLPASDAEPPTTTSHVALTDDDIAYAVLPAELLVGCTPANLAECLAAWKATLPQRQAGGRMIRYLWDLLRANTDQLGIDFRRRRSTAPVATNSTINVVGPRERMWVDPSAQLDANAVVDTTAGPVLIERECVVTAFSRIAGPCSIGAGTQLLAAKVGPGTTLGPCCHVAGEVEGSIVQGLLDQSLGSFLSHSYLGERITLGPGSRVRDARDDHRIITVTVAGRPVITGRRELGCFLGDGTEIGPGTWLDCGTSAGVGCHLARGLGSVPRFVPSFCGWGENGPWETDACHTIQAARKVLPRDEALNKESAALYRQLAQETSSERRIFLNEHAGNWLRRSA
jgi:hypothetical protein